MFLNRAVPKAVDTHASLHLRFGSNVLLDVGTEQ